MNLDWLFSEWQLTLPLFLGWLAVCWALPAGKARSRAPAILLGLAAFGIYVFSGKSAGGLSQDDAAAGQTVLHFLGRVFESPEVRRELLFYVFAVTAVGSAALMITDRNPVYAALWFAVTTLAVCGLFLLSSAPFLAAATVIVYAGAIVVTFLFVIMLAQQAGATNYDQRAYQPAAATIAAFVLLGCFLVALQSWGATGESLAAEAEQPAANRQRFLHPSESQQANRLSRPAGDDLGSLRNVGRSLFTDYLFAVEIAGTVLLIATIGAIAIAPRRTQGTF